MYPFITIFSRRLPSYGVMMTLGLLVAGFLAMLRVRKSGQRWEDGLAILACGFGTALLGAVALYIIITYPFAEFLQLLRSGELFSGEHLGLVFYGGVLGALPGALLGARIAHVRLMGFVSPMLPCLPLGHAFGRLGCLLAGCCYGKPTSLPIGVVYTVGYSGVPTGIPLLPVQAFESAALLLIFLILAAYTRHGHPPMRVMALYLLLYSPCRFALEFLRYDAIRGAFLCFSTSQWLSILLAVAGIVLWYFSKRDKQPV